MGKRINRTICNWRWWVALPVVAILIPLTATEFALRGIAAVAIWIVETWDDTLDGAARAIRLQQFLAWVRKGARHD